MRSLFVIFPGNEKGGAATHLLAFARAVSDAHLFPDFYFVSVGGGPLLVSMERVVGRDNLMKLPARPAQALSGLIRLMRHATSDSIWHANGPRMNVLTGLAATVTRRRWTTTLHSDVRNDFLGSRWKTLLLTRVHLTALKRTIGGFIGNPEFAQFLPNKSAYYVPNAVNPDPLNATKDSYSSQLKTRLCIPPACKLVGTAARFDPVKDIPTILCAISLLDDPLVHFVLAGDGAERLELMSLVDSLGITSRVHFVGFLDEVAPFYAGLDVHVLASRSEGASPFAILEAGSCDTANIGSDIPGIRNLIEPDVTGLCFPVGDALQLAQQLNRALEDSHLRQSLVHAFRTQVLPKYTSFAMLQAYLQGYQEMAQDTV